MKRVFKVTLLVLASLVLLSCAQQKQLTWEAVPDTGSKATFDGKKEVLVARKSGITLEFTPLPYLEKIDEETFGGTIALSNNARDYVTVLWETVDLSDSFGFFKIFRFGQKKRLSVSFPEEDAEIPPGNVQVFSFTLSKAEYESARDLVEYAAYLLMLPFQYSGETETFILEVPYSVRELK